ncbi:LysE family transporter [Roseibium sp. CAU 1637]|uniref:LysE family transporter n=1 Tax=Roseibium limicola TaxID=2816037 RepID=A0A939ESU2_9HYPH|nr:LysE family transporter [Roseibium limicola]MBO0347266.1 LysE family transporter [Roseibium limicola]
MDFSALTAFALFVIVMTGTPGPGNLTFMAIGASAGYGAAFPVIVASQLGSIVLNVCVAFGLGKIMAESGAVAVIFKGLSFAYMSYLAWRLVRLNVTPKGATSLPGFWEGVLIHPLSPKTWAMSLSAYATFFSGSAWSLPTNAAVMTAGFVLGGSVFHSLWALAGVSVLKLIGEGPLLRFITSVMAIAMLAVTAWALFL